MNVRDRYSATVAHRRPSASRLALAVIAIASVFAFAPARAQSFGVGQRADCDPTGLKTRYSPGTIIPTHPGERFNGNAAGTGYFFRVRLDGGDPDGVLCKAEDMRPARAPSPAANVAGRKPEGEPAAVERAATRVLPAAGGNRFGTRSPRTSCPTVKSMPNLDQIKALVQCDDERGSNDSLIYLDENLTVQSGGTRKYSQFSDGYATGIDTDAPVLPIRGSLDSYQCAALSKYTNVGTVYDTDNTGKNCVVTSVRQAQGTCWRTTFGDWFCHLNENVGSASQRLNQPPP